MTDEYVDQLWKSPEPFRWLRDRGLTDETIWNAKLGYVDEPAPEQDRYQGAISIPYFDALGRQAGMRFRHLVPEKVERHKYQALPGSGVHLYGIEHVDAPEIFLIEGEFDALILRQTGRVAIGVPGATAWQRQWRWLFRNCDLVHVVWDGDASTNENVRKGRNKVTGSLSNITELRVVELPDEKDATELYLEGRLEAAL